MKKKEEMQKESTMSDVELASKITAVLEEGLRNAQNNRNTESPEYRIGKMEAYMEVLNVIQSNYE